jgi:hypothetical protein
MHPSAPRASLQSSAPVTFLFLVKDMISATWLTDGVCQHTRMHMGLHMYGEMFNCRMGFPPQSMLSHLTAILQFTMSRGGIYAKSEMMQWQTTVNSVASVVAAEAAMVTAATT